MSPLHPPDPALSLGSPDLPVPECPFCGEPPGPPRVAHPFADDPVRRRGARLVCDELLTLPGAQQVQKIRRSRGRVEPVFVEHLADLPANLAGLLENGDVVVTLGAGSIGQAAASLATAITEAP